MATLALPTAVQLEMAEHRFYSRMALLMTAVIFIGFMPSFYLRGMVHYPRPNPSLAPHVIVHGLVFSVWLLIFVAQTQLVAASRRDLHMILGSLSFVIALALVPLMYLTAVWQVGRQNAPPFTDPLDWTIVPLSGIIPFALMLWIGWTSRREAQWHKRAMLVAMLMIMQPGIGRFPIGPPSLLIHAVGAMLTLALFIPLILWDRKTIGELHPVTSLGLSLTALVMIIQVGVLATNVWAPVAAHLPGVAT